MTNWDQDIHRIQEIQQVLENRQRYFRGHLSTSHYKLDPEGNPLFFPRLRSISKKADSEEPSVGHSLKANFGSTETGSNDLSVCALNKDSENKNGESGFLSDANDGNCADHSQSESSDASAEDNKDAKKKVVRKNARTLRKWVDKHLEESLPTTVHSKLINASSSELSTSRKPSSVLRFKSVSFDNGEGEADVESTKAFDELLTMPKITKSSKKRRASNPIKLLRCRSWILKAEMATRLNEDANELNLNPIINGLTKSSISQAREKLKKAEKSLKATVNNGYRMPNFRQQGSVGVTKLENKVSPSIPKNKLLSQHSVSRLALRQQKDSVRSDINLREAFALIKIDPDPLLRLAVPENLFKPSQSRKNMEDDKKLSESKSHRKFDLNDSRTVKSLQMLTKLSNQHLQKQQALIPNSSLVSISPKHAKKAGKLKSKITLDFNKSSSLPRKGSVTTNNQQYVPPNDKKPFKDSSASHDVILAKLLSGKVAATSQERKAHFNGDPIHRYTLDRLSGTVI